MATQPPHNKILYRVAKATFTPVGLHQKGKSRLWYDDHGNWLIIVEFQPSTWERGTYLNVGCMWLLYPYDHFAYHEGNRVHDFVPYRTDQDFEIATERLAREAIRKVEEYRIRFGDMESIRASCLAKMHERPFDLWSRYFAAVLSALTGHNDESKRIFEQIAAGTYTFDYQQTIQSLAKELLPLVSDDRMFAKRIDEIVLQARQNNHIEPIQKA